MEAEKPAPARPVHLNFIEGMRAAAALVVLVNHGYAQIWEPAANQFPPRALGFLTYSLVAGHLAVSVFICISGFCLMLPVARGDGTLQGGAIQFFKRRVRRILPPYYAALVFSLLLIVTVIGKPTGTLWDVCIQIRPSDLVGHVLLLQHFFGTGRINYAFWSISLEWQIYFFFPLFVLGFRRLGAPLTTLIALAAGYATTILVPMDYLRIHRANLHFFGLFVVGMAAARVAFSREPGLERARSAVPWAGLAALIFGVEVALICHLGWVDAMARWPFLDLLSASSAACALVAAAAPGSNLLRRAFELRPLVSIGRYSYSLYLVHAPLLQIFWQYLLKPLGLDGAAAFGAIAVFGTPLILLTAQLFYRWCEKPFATSRTPRVAAVVPPVAG
jgi:peptidoglycan/LPS O-acetylase OafA/YrhL